MYNCWQVCTQQAEHINSASYPFSGSKNIFFTNLSDSSITRGGNLYVLAEDKVSRPLFPFLALRGTKKTRRLPLAEESNPSLLCKPISYPGPEHFSTHPASTRRYGRISRVCYTIFTQIQSC